MSTLDRKFYEVPKNEEKQFIQDLRKTLFPKASIRDFEILSDWYSMRHFGENEIPYSDATFKTRHGKIDPNSTFSAFGGHVAGIQSNSYNPEKIWIRQEYKFLIDESLESFRLAKDLFEPLKELKIKESNLQPRSGMNYFELEEKLKIPLEIGYEKATLLLLEIGLLYCGSRPGAAPYHLKNLGIEVSMRTTNDFDSWYLEYTNRFRVVLAENKRQRWEGKLLVRLYRKLFPIKATHEDLSVAMGIYTAPPEKKNVRGLFLLFLLFLLLGALALYFFSQNNTPVFGVFAMLAGGILMRLIEKAF